MQVDSLIHARWVIPVEPEAEVYEHYSIVIDNARIVDLLPQAQARSQYQSDHSLELTEHALIPGLVNAHTHAAMSLFRGIADDLPLMEWLQKHIWPLEQKWVSESFVQAGSELAIAEMLRAGVTCFNDMYFYPEVTARTAISAGMRASIGLILIDFPSNWAQNPQEYLSKGRALFDEVSGQPLISTPFAPHAPYTVSDASLQMMHKTAEQQGMPLRVHMHVHEIAHEVDESVKQHGVRPLERLRNAGMLDSGFMAVHMTQLTDEEIEFFAASGGSVVHCPESNLKLASGFCPVAKLLERGVNVALGTDSAASNNDLDMLGEMKTAALLAKAVAGDASAVPAHTTLRMASLNGAKALGLEAEIGSLQIGKQADITAIRMDQLETQPLFDPISQIVYAANRSEVSDVWVAGKRLLASGDLTTMDLDNIQHNTATWAERLRTSELERQS